MMDNQGRHTMMDNQGRHTMMDNQGHHLMYLLVTYLHMKNVALQFVSHQTIFIENIYKIIRCFHPCFKTITSLHRSNIAFQQQPKSQFLT